MKVKFISTIIVVLQVFLASQSINAQTDKPRYICGKHRGVLATKAVMPDGEEAVILTYSSGVFEGAGFSDQKRCEEIASRFQYFNDLREMDFLTVGKINGQDVICVTRQERGECSKDLKWQGLLFTIPPGVNAIQTLRTLELLRVRSVGFN
jgi:hypothetical protein